MVKWWGLPTRGQISLISGDDLFIYIDKGTTGGSGGESGGGCSAGKKPAYRSRRLLLAHW